jgi:hypothetical protein
VSGAAVNAAIVQKLAEADPKGPWSKMFQAPLGKDQLNEIRKDNETFYGDFDEPVQEPANGWEAVLEARLQAFKNEITKAIMTMLGGLIEKDLPNYIDQIVMARLGSLGLIGGPRPAQPQPQPQTAAQPPAPQQQQVSKEQLMALAQRMQAQAATQSPEQQQAAQAQLLALAQQLQAQQQGQAQSQALMGGQSSVSRVMDMMRLVKALGGDKPQQPAMPTIADLMNMMDSVGALAGKFNALREQIAAPAVASQDRDLEVRQRQAMIQKTEAQAAGEILRAEKGLKPKTTTKKGDK